MCLEITKPKEPLIAEEDIVCYKVVWYDFKHKDTESNVQEVRKYKGDINDLSVVFSSLYYHMPVELGKKYKNHQKLDFWECDEANYFLEEDEDKWYELNAGVYHSFEYLEDAITELQEQCTRGIVVRCIIPKGTKYYSGNYYGIDSYGSRVLRYTNVIEFEGNWEDALWGEEWDTFDMVDNVSTLRPLKDCHTVYYLFLDICKANGIKYTIGEELAIEEESYRDQLAQHITE